MKYKHVISLGCNCAVASQLRTYGVRKASYPFDWLVTGASTVFLLINNQFVILDSMPVRDLGFRKVLEKFNKVDVDKLIKFHNINGGLSRFVKIKYFFNDILKTEISEKDGYVIVKGVLIEF